MRTADDFNCFYSAPDPWKLTQARFRDRIYKRLLSHLIRGRRILELGCGEGHLTKVVFDKAASIKGVDISDVAIQRARLRNLSNAEFECSDFLATKFEGFDVVTAIECLNYLTPNEREFFFGKLRREHAGKLFVFSNPIIGGNYFLHSELLETFSAFSLHLTYYRNLNVYWKPARYRIIANLMKLPFLDRSLDLLPDRLIYQRLYILEVPK